VLAYRKGGSEAKQQGVSVGSSVTLTIERVGSLAGTVTSPDGPPRSLMINLQDARTGYQRSERFFFSGGKWAMRDLPAGTYDIAVLAPTGKGKLDDIVLGAGEDRSGVDLALAATVDVTGRLVDGETKVPVKGLQVFISPIGGPVSITMADMEDEDHVSKDDGRFTVHNVAPGKTGLIVFPSFTDPDSKYTSTMRNITVEGTGTVDLGDIVMQASRLPPDTDAGDLGFTLTDYPPDTNPADVALKVASVRAGGPAAAAGLQVGDVIVSVDGTDVRGDNSFDYYTLSRVPAGTTLALGLERGDTVSIKAGPPR
jgi:membrane-associated protease RseP (regulator of RpoE activity)